MSSVEPPLARRSSFEDRMATGRVPRRTRAPTSPSTATRAGAARRAACVVACPANLFVPTADGGILFNYEQCFECGTCYLVCNDRGRHHLDLPRGRPRRRLPPELSHVRRDRRLREVGRPPPEVDPLTGAVHRRRTLAGPSDADQAALEMGAALRRAWGGDGRRRDGRPPGRRGASCAGALGAGARAPSAVDWRTTPPSEPWPSRAGAGAGRMRPACGAATSRSTAAAGRCPPTWPRSSARPRPSAWWPSSSPARPASVAATRRLDGGRRERLRVHAPAVLSVEGATARLRRASLSALAGGAAAGHRRAARPSPSPARAPAADAGRSGPGPGSSRHRSGDTARDRIVALTGARLGDRRRPPPSSWSPARPPTRILATLAGGATWTDREAGRRHLARRRRARGCCSSFPVGVVRAARSPPPARHRHPHRDGAGRRRWPPGGPTSSWRPAVAYGVERRARRLRRHAVDRPGRARARPGRAGPLGRSASPAWCS